jgi:hypothetical protein
MDMWPSGVAPSVVALADCSELPLASSCSHDRRLASQVARCSFGTYAVPSDGCEFASAIETQAAAADELQKRDPDLVDELLEHQLTGLGLSIT